MMTAGVASIDCRIPIADSEGGEYWDAAMAFSLIVLSFLMDESSQGRYLGMTYAHLIDDVEASPNTFQLCLKHIADRKFGGTAAVSARQILAKLDRLPC